MLRCAALCAAALVCVALPALANAAPAREPLRFGVLPVLQALPLFVAAEQGLFAKAGVEVELVPFNSAMEKDVALASGRLDGCFGDLATSITARNGGNDFRLTATIFDTASDRRMFGIALAPGSAPMTLAEAAKAGIAGSSNTINEYVTAKLLGLPDVSLVETKNIPVRMQMLMAGQLAAAFLPEPLLSLAELQGAKVIADDAGKGLSATVLGFLDPVLVARRDEVRRFHAAVREAARRINADPEAARPVMVRACRIPEPLQAKFAVPRYPDPLLPAEAQVMDMYRWLRARGVARVESTYPRLVADGFLP